MNIERSQAKMAFEMSKHFLFLDACDLGYCRNGGTCKINGVTKKPFCFCPKYYVGDRCEVRHPGKTRPD